MTKTLKGFLIAALFLVVAICAVGCGCSHEGGYYPKYYPSKSNSTTISSVADSSNETSQTSKSEADNPISNSASAGESTSSECIHSFRHIEAKPATCGEFGWEAYDECIICSYSTRVIIPKLSNHSSELIEVKGKAPTCTEKGLTSGKKCSVCGKFVEPQVELEALGHKIQPIPEVKGTCEKIGYSEGTKCSVCGEILIAPTPTGYGEHETEIITGKQPTCTESGLTDGKKCKLCDTIVEAQTEIPALGHDKASNHCSRCGESVESVGLQFELINDTAYALTGLGTCADEWLVVPSSFNSLPVTKINGLVINSTIKQITIPSTITKIEMQAFTSATNLNAVYISDLSAWCKIDFADSAANPLSVAHKLYLNGVHVKKLSLPETTIIKQYAFYGADINSVTLPYSLNAIGSEAFKKCTKLWEIYNLSGYISNFVKGSNDYGEIAKYALEIYTSSTQQDKINQSNGFVIYTKTLGSQVKYLLEYVGESSEIVIPDGISIINQCAFENNSLVESIKLTKDLTEIKKDAFKNADNLKAITFDSTVSDFEKIVKADGYLSGTQVTKIICTDGEINIDN